MRRLAFVLALALMGASPDPMTIRVAITPINYDAIPMLYARRTGTFAKAGGVKYHAIPYRFAAQEAIYKP
ncbi:MAG TPA: hypothetical protein VN603_08505 [Candidatus Acidoferrales bacterium]|nr:hypothetical protein [Candidatus Acidoferrales bacterium]